MEEISENILDEMKLHEEKVIKLISPRITVFKVVGGWVYIFKTNKATALTSCFVPYKS